MPLHSTEASTLEGLYQSSLPLPYTDSILKKIKEAGFDIAYEKELTLTKEQAGEFYREHEGKDFFDSLTTHMSRYVCPNGGS